MSATFASCGVAAAALLLLGTGAHASPKPVKTELDKTTDRGILLAEYDKAAWQATDAVTEVHPIEGRIERYIARKTEAGWVVDFGRLSASGDRFLVAYEAAQTGSPAKFKVNSFDPVRSDTSWNLTAAKAAEMATRDFGATSRPYNIAVLPVAGGNLYVYLYPAQVKEGVYPLGGDVRYRISPDGVKIVEKRQMHKSIIESAPASADMKVATGYHTHVLSDVPEDTDVLLVLTRQPRVPEIVVAGAHMYTIGVDGKITVADKPRVKPSQP